MSAMIIHISVAAAQLMIVAAMAIASMPQRPSARPLATGATL